MATEPKDQSGSTTAPADDNVEAAPYCLLGPKGNDVLSDLKSDERLSRIRALLAQWMRMENIVVLLASGCSSGEGIGGKTLAALEDAVLAVLSARYGSKEDVILKQIVDARAAARKKDGSQSFEGWLSHLSNTQHLLESPNSPVSAISWKDDKASTIQLDPASARRLLLDVEHSIYGFCAIQMPAIEGGARGHHAFFAKLIARDPGLGRGHVFTLNYDTLIEQTLDQLGVLYFDGFGGKTETKFDPSVYGLDVYYPGEVAAGRVRRYDKFLHLYKLHGSIHWYQASDDSVRAFHQPLDKFSAWRDASDNESRAKQLDKLWSDGRRMAILPTTNKFVQTLDLPFSHLFRVFHQRLNTPQTFFIVVGYGFSDDHVNQIIDAAMTNPSLIMLVVDPTPAEQLRAKLKRYQDIGERVFLLCSRTAGDRMHATFDDFAVNLMPQVQWLDDYIKLRRYEKTVGETMEQSAPP